MRIKLLGLLLSFSLLLCGCTGNTAEKKNSEEAVKKTQNVFAMNTYITLTAYGENAKSALTDSENRIRELEKLLSVTDESSEIYHTQSRYGECHFLCVGNGEQDKRRLRADDLSGADGMGIHNRNLSDPHTGDY